MEESKWIVKWGLLGLKVKGLTGENIKERSDVVKKLNINDVVNIFKKSEHIFDINIGEQDKINFILPFMELSEPINLLIKIPKREIEESDFHLLSKEYIDFGTEFNVMYNGYLYIIYRKIDTTKKDFRGDWQIRELLEKLIEKSGNYESVSIPPTPFREELFISFSADKGIRDVKLDKTGDNEVEVVLPNGYSIENFFRKFYHNLYIDFYSYFRVLKNVKELEKIERNINELFVEITENCLFLQNLKFYQFYEKHKLKKKIKRSIADQFINFSNYQNILKIYSSDKDICLLEISNNQFFNNYIDKFKKEIQYSGIDFESIHSLIDYSKDVIVAHEGNINYLIGALLGGFFTIIGVIIGKMI
ncbi:Uncharacterised protein [uncultured archaeon]|nr:Uncharacterised protein [uncultured archaeon]